MSRDFILQQERCVYLSLGNSSLGVVGEETTHNSNKVGVSQGDNGWGHVFLHFWGNFVITDITLNLQDYK